MKNIKLILEFDGTNYGGWQKQNNNKTIQEELEKAIRKATGEDIEVIGSSRTDAGVHSRGMTANFKTNSSIPPERFREAVNRHLPDDIAILKSEEVNDSFHARYDSKGKTYSYTIVNRYEKVSIGRNYVYHVKDELDLLKMQEACKYFIGKHDFTAFKTNGSSVKTSVRTIKELYMEKDGDSIRIFVTADGFLYNMVRIIVGTLLEVGKGKIDPKSIENIIESKDRNQSGPCVQPNGLVLEKVYY
ncbi:MAG: tRNA pseudouridine(38-40) synthase TruA [Clostridium sp.]|uniref:tRNA pseudouridine(38-40) synthase TruA n=1 Tax=Clostridium sp. DSM 8431 TaxID=1761781 RepID=UPI0008EF11FA|nr:tRNA pseudouridine(38-40) synthase TruA [Clostridium sp. DSM 8431]MCR4944880.1 tRNA pseudouridine(38-40) synthase TruA [Clostridium sp.]SFU30073.1 tRNA pseudouridine38-40 synthase [Clostridium sp. DSM 8431]